MYRMSKYNTVAEQYLYDLAGGEVTPVHPFKAALYLYECVPPFNWLSGYQAVPVESPMPRALAGLRD